MPKPFDLPMIERRIYPLTELRIAVDNEPPIIRGYAAVFNELSEDLGGFYERIKPGAFKKTLKEADIRALWNHDPNYVLGRNKSGTLRLAEDERGLAIEIDPPVEARWAQDLIVSMKRGDVDQMSFGFRTVRDEWVTAGEQIIRTLLEVELFDVSPVTFAAYLQTSVQVRALDERITGIIRRMRSGEQISAEELIVLDIFLDQDGVPAPGQESHPGDGEQHAQASIDLLRRRLDLANL